MANTNRTNTVLERALELVQHNEAYSFGDVIGERERFRTALQRIADLPQPTRLRRSNHWRKIAREALDVE